MRGAIAKVYDTASWRKKVNNMYDDQVIAIYYNFAHRGILNKTMKKERPTKVDEFEIKTKEQYQQLTFFDSLETINDKEVYRT